MKKLTARNSTFLHNAKLMFGAPAYKRILAAAQHSEGQAWNVAREYISLDGSEATRKVMFSERYADLDTMFRAIKAEFSAEPAAIAANVSADAAPAWTPAVGDVVHVKPSGRVAVVIAIEAAYYPHPYLIQYDDSKFGHCSDDELEPAPDAAQTAAAGDEMAELMYEAGGIIEEAIKMRREKDEQIAQLTRDLEAARTEAAALREAFERSEKYVAIEQQVKDERLSALMDEADKLVAALESISPMEGLTRLLSFRRVYNEFVQELHRAEAQADAALASARQRADDGTRHSVADVEAALEAQWAEAWTPKVGDRVRIKADARFDHMNAAAREQIESIRDAHIVGRVIDRALGLVKVDFEGICPNMVAEKLEPEAQS